MKYLKNNMIFLTITLITCFALSTPPPPVLTNINNNCWHNSGLQLMRNIKPITQALLDDKSKPSQKQEYYHKGNESADAYINFLAAAAQGTQENINATIKKLYESCVLPVDRDNIGQPLTVVSFIQNTFPDLFKKYCSPEIQYTLQKKFKNEVIEVKRNPQAPYLLADWLEMNKQISPDTMPDYLLLLVNNVSKKKVIELNNTIENSYELIGATDAYKQESSDFPLSGGHHWAWIKDEFSNEPMHPWYKRNDINALDIPDNKQQDIADQSKFIESLESPTFLLYKKISQGSSKEISDLAQSLKSLIEKNN